MRKIKTRSEFILNESVIKYSKKFLSVLYRIFKESGNEIAGDLIEVNETDVDVVNNYIDLGEGDSVTFTPDKKAQRIASELLDFNRVQIFNLNRQPMKIGRFVRSFAKSIGKNYSDKEIEDFVNLYKSSIENKNYFRLIKGDEISYWYNQNRYEDLRGTLGNSCMKNKNDEIFNIYTKNPDKVSLLILMGLNNPEKIRGRAIIWEIDYISGNRSNMTFMDRVYYTEDHIVNLFRQYAQENGWGFKYNNDFLSQTIVVKDGEKTEMTLATELEKFDFNYYPYLDTMKFLDNSDGVIGNIGEVGEYYLRCTDGDHDIFCEDCDSNGSTNCHTCDGDGKVNCPECNGRRYIACTICDGVRELDCSDCEGGTSACKECNGSGEIDGEECEECVGSGRLECGLCVGTGYISCECDSDGEVSCRNCNRSGRVTCTECHGDCQYPCETCEPYR